MVQDERGCLPAVVGAVLGMTIGGLLFGCAGYAFFAYQLRDDPRGLPGLGAIIVAIPAALIGQILGCWLTLRWAEFKAAGATAAVLAIIMLLSVIATIRFIRGDGDIDGLVTAWFMLPVVAPALARAIVIAFRRP